MYGNNLTALKTQKINVLMVAQDETTVPFPPPYSGKKYFFPDTPTIDAGYIVGIEAHLKQTTGAPGEAGDLKDIVSAGDFTNTNFSVNSSKFLFVNIYGEDNDLRFTNIPLSSLFPLQPGLTKPPIFKKTVKPYFGKINTRASYVWLPPGFSPILQCVVSLTFFYR
jgi:hypothetical protein